MFRHIRKKEKVFNFLTCYNHYCKFLVGMLHFPAQTFFRDNFILSLQRLRCLLGRSADAYPENTVICGKCCLHAQVCHQNLLCSPGAVFVLQKCYLSSAKLFLTRLCFRALERRWKQHLCRALGICDSSCNKTLLSWILNPLQTHEQSDKTELRFAVFITLTADQGKEEKTNPNQESQRP